MKKVSMICLGALMLAPAQLAVAKSDKAKAAIVLPAPKPGKGQVVFFRPGGMGSAVKCTIREDGKMVGRVGSKRYYVIDAEPGVHTYTAKSEATDAVTVQVEPDETSFVKCKIAMGMMVGRPNLSPAVEMDFSTETKIEPMDAAKIAAEIAEDQAKKAASASGAAPVSK